MSVDEASASLKVAMFPNSCRTCLKFLNEDETTKFPICQYILDNQVLRQILKSICDIHVEHADGLPQAICISCLSRLCDAHNFIQICKSSEQVLKGTSSLTSSMKCEENMILEVKENTIETEYDQDVEESDSDQEPEVQLFDFKSRDEISKVEEASTKEQIIIVAEELFKCEMCVERFTDKRDLVVHMEEHANVRPHICQICGKSFVQGTSLRKHQLSRHSDKNVVETDSALADHMSTHGESGNLWCDQCGKGYKNKSTLKMHMKSHSGEEPYRCDVCNKEFHIKRHLEIHAKIHTGERPYQCTLCDKTFSQSAHLTTHRRTHTGEKPYKCGFCPKSFAVTSNRRTHEKAMHSGMTRAKCPRIRKQMSAENSDKKTYVCEICGKHFGQLGSFRIHKLVHSGVKPYQCKLCNKRFRQQSHLSVHTKMHSSERPHTCEFCGKRFKVKSNLRVHLRTHTGEKPFECLVCLRKFRDLNNMRRHKETHVKQEAMEGCGEFGDFPKGIVIGTENDQEPIVCEIRVLKDGELASKPYGCSVCGKYFPQYRDVTVHMRVHTGERPYKCEFCGKSFAAKSNFRVHLRRHNGETRFSCKLCDKPFYESSGLTRHMKTHNRKLRYELENEDTVEKIEVICEDNVVEDEG